MKQSIRFLVAIGIRPDPRFPNADRDPHPEFFIVSRG